MKTFDQLTLRQKTDAVDMAFYELTNLLADGTLEIKLANANAQIRLESIMRMARKTEKPRLITLFMIHDKPVRTEIERLALVAAHGSEYNDDGNAMKEVDVETAKRIALS